MKENNQQDSLENLRHIREVMDRSARVLSLSGWSGVWAGAVALAGTFLAYRRMAQMSAPDTGSGSLLCSPEYISFLLLAAGVFIIAVAGAVFFTWRKNIREGHNIWNKVSGKMLISLSIPIMAGAVFCLIFIQQGHLSYPAPFSLLVYGLALINTSKYTLTDIRYLGLCEIVLACIAIVIPEYGLYFWGFGFGALHIFYGLFMWNKYRFG